MKTTKTQVLKAQAQGADADAQAAAKDALMYFAEKADVIDYLQDALAAADTFAACKCIVTKSVNCVANVIIDLYFEYTNIAAQNEVQDVANDFVDAVSDAVRAANCFGCTDAQANADAAARFAAAKAKAEKAQGILQSMLNEFIQVQGAKDADALADAVAVFAVLAAVDVDAVAAAVLA